MSDLWRKEDIVSDMQSKYDQRVVLVESKESSKIKTYTKWASERVTTIWGKKREDLKAGQCNFSYIKFAKNERGESFAIVAAVSQFHKKYTSDIRFYDINAKQTEVAVFMRKNKLVWDESKILFFLNEDKEDRKEALDNEKKLQGDYKLFN